MGALQVSTDIIINQPILEVAGYAADPDNASVWYDNIKSAVWISEPPLQLGSQITFTAEFMGRTRFIPMRSLSMSQGKS